MFSTNHPAKPLIKVRKQLEPNPINVIFDPGLSNQIHCISHNSVIK